MVRTAALRPNEDTLVIDTVPALAIRNVTIRKESRLVLLHPATGPADDPAAIRERLQRFPDALCPIAAVAGVVQLATRHDSVAHYLGRKRNQLRVRGHGILQREMDCIVRLGDIPPVVHTMVVHLTFRLFCIHLGWIPACAGMTTEENKGEEPAMQMHSELQPWNCSSFHAHERETDVMNHIPTGRSRSRSRTPRRG